MSTQVPALGDIQKQIQDKVAVIRARITDLKSKLPFTPPGFFGGQSILQRGAAQGQGIVRRNLLRRPQATSRPTAIITGNSLCPQCRPAIVDMGPTRTSHSGAAVSEEIDPTRRFGLSIAT